jgi:hypothetical protein
LIWRRFGRTEWNPVCVQMAGKSDVNQGKRSTSAFVYTKEAIQAVAKRICKSSHWNLKTNQSQTAATLPQTKPRIQITRTDHIAFASRPFLTRKQGQHNDADTFPKSLQRPGHGTLALEQSRPYISFHHIRRKDCRVSSGAFLRENDTHAFPHLKESGDTRRLLHILLGVWLVCFWSFFLGTAWALEGLLWGWGGITGSVSNPYPM